MVHIILICTAALPLFTWGLVGNLREHFSRLSACPLVESPGLTVAGSEAEGRPLKCLGSVSQDHELDQGHRVSDRTRDNLLRKEVPCRWERTSKQGKSTGPPGTS